MTREKPIIFSTPMVQAILAGRKTQTRRVIKKDIVNRFDLEHDGKSVFAFVDQETGDEIKLTDIASYQPDDILWVRETWTYCDSAELAVNYTDPRLINGYCYKVGEAPDDGSIKWRSPIHMPRIAARLFLRVINVRAEKLQDIAIDDCIAEGYPETVKQARKSFNYKDGIYRPRAKIWYEHLWDNLNAKRGHDWESNPYVWVIEFEEVKT